MKISKRDLRIDHIEKIMHEQEILMDGNCCFVRILSCFREEMMVLEDPIELERRWLEAKEKKQIKVGQLTNKTINRLVQKFSRLMNRNREGTVYSSRLYWCIS